jgi:isopenicillin N synthase-like dioxygenase
MPTPNYFNGCPEFPSDVSVADIPTISFNDLKNNRDQASEKLYEACREYGLFLLGLTKSEEGGILLKDAEMMFDISAAMFNLEPEVLERYAYNPPKELLG